MDTFDFVFKSASVSYSETFERNFWLCEFCDFEGVDNMAVTTFWLILYVELGSQST